MGQPEYPPPYACKDWKYRWHNDFFCKGCSENRNKYLRELKMRIKPKALECKEEK